MHAMGHRPSAANRCPAEPVEELQAVFFEEDVLALPQRQARDDRSPLRPPHEHRPDDHEGDDDDHEQRNRHRQIVRPPAQPTRRQTDRFLSLVCYPVLDLAVVLGLVVVAE